MLILTLIGLLIGGIVIYAFIQWFNRYTVSKANYEFFTVEHSVAIMASYAMIFFGYVWFSNARTAHGDWLNGALIVGIGSLILLSLIVNNFLKTPKRIAFMGTIAQLIVYIPITMGGVIIVLVLMAFFAETKPVYVINSED